MSRLLPWWRHVALAGAVAGLLAWPWLGAPPGWLGACLTAVAGLAFLGSRLHVSRVQTAVGTAWGRDAAVAICAVGDARRIRVRLRVESGVESGVPVRVCVPVGVGVAAPIAAGNVVHVGVTVGVGVTITGEAARHGQEQRARGDGDHRAEHGRDAVDERRRANHESLPPPFRDCTPRTTPRCGAGQLAGAQTEAVRLGSL